MESYNIEEMRWYRDLHRKIASRYSKPSTPLSPKNSAIVSSEFHKATKVLRRTYKKLGKPIK